MNRYAGWLAALAALIVMLSGCAAGPEKAGGAVMKRNEEYGSMAPPRAHTIVWKIPPAVADEVRTRYAGDMLRYWQAHGVVLEPGALELSPDGRTAKIHALPVTQRRIQGILGYAPPVE